MLSPGNQQNIADWFLANDTTTINDFISDFCNMTSDFSDHNFNSIGVTQDEPINITNTPNDDIKLFNDLKFVIELFQQEQILSLDSNVDHDDLYKFFKRNKSKRKDKNSEFAIVKPVHDIIKEYYAKIFIIDKSKLKEFIGRDYKTKEQYDKEQKELKKDIQNRTEWRFKKSHLLLAFIGLIIAIAVAIITFEQLRVSKSNESAKENTKTNKINDTSNTNN